LKLTQLTYDYNYMTPYLLTDLGIILKLRTFVDLQAVTQAEIFYLKTFQNLPEDFV